ncbi:MAG: PH domain-containing protein [Clostridia bacterium]|nr:PH domain-containing protein [Clostridia bacterium]MBR3195265.1 PH domain-containing protein [Clostridia bacterium]
MALKSINYLWSDRKRWLGIPWTFTKYSLSEDRFFIKKGFLNKTYDEVLLYRVRDISLKRSLWQRMFGVGTIMLYASDATNPAIEVKNIKQSEQVKELIHLNVETCKDKRRMRYGELVDDRFIDEDGDGLPD